MSKVPLWAGGHGLSLGLAPAAGHARLAGPAQTIEMVSLESTEEQRALVLQRQQSLFTWELIQQPSECLLPLLASTRVVGSICWAGPTAGTATGVFSQAGCVCCLGSLLQRWFGLAPLIHCICRLLIPYDLSHCGFENIILHLRVCPEQSVTKAE